MAIRKGDILAKIALREARAGNLGPLIGRVRFSSMPLTDGEREYIAAALEDLDGKRGKAMDRQIEKTLIAQRVEGLIEEGFSTEAAVTKVMQERGRKRSTVFTALKESKKLK
jgi:hypothetical protein